MSTITVNGREISTSHFRNDWAMALMSQGVIVKLTVSWWRATTPLKAEDLGIKFQDDETISFMKRYVKFGTENLLPPEIASEIRCIDQKARNNLKEHSFDTIWGRFVPFTAFAQWQDNDKVIREDFYIAAQSLFEKYDHIIQIVKEEYRKMAKDVWARLYPQDKSGSPHEAFVENFVSNIIGKIPSRSTILNTFQYDTTYFVIPLPTFVEENISAAEEIKNKRDVKKFNDELEKETKRRISEEYIQRKQEYIDEFLEATVSSMRAYVSELCDSVLLSIEKHSGNNDVSKAQRNKIKSIIKKVQMLNFHDDNEIGQMLKDLGNEVDKFKGERSKDIIVEKLQSIVDLSKKEFLPANFNPIISSLDI